MSSKDIARRIAEDLLDNNVLDENNFNYDTDAILEYVQDTVLSHLRDFTLVSGVIYSIIRFKIIVKNAKEVSNMLMPLLMKDGNK